MEDSLTAIFIGTVLLIILAIIWAWTTIKTKAIDHQIATSVNSHQTERDVTVAKIQLEGTKQTNSTTENIAHLKDSTEREKILSDKEYRDKQILIQAKAFDVQLDQEKMKQEGENSRSLLHHQTTTNIAEMEIRFRGTELNSKVEMFNKGLEFKTQKLEQDGQIRHRTLDVQREALASNEKVQLYMTDKTFEGISLVQDNENQRHASLMDTQKYMHRETMETKKVLGMASIESNERIQIKGIEGMMFEAEQRTEQSRIQADSSNDLITGLVGAAASILTKGLVPIGGEKSVGTRIKPLALPSISTKKIGE